MLSRRRLHADVAAVIVIPLVLALVTLTVRAAGGDAAGQLGWVQLILVARLLPVACAAAVVLAAVLVAVAAAWAELLRWRCNNGV